MDRSNILPFLITLTFLASSAVSATEKGQRFEADFEAVALDITTGQILWTYGDLEEGASLYFVKQHLLLGTWQLPQPFIELDEETGRFIRELSYSEWEDFTDVPVSNTQGEELGFLSKGLNTGYRGEAPDLLRRQNDEYFEDVQRIASCGEVLAAARSGDGLVRAFWLADGRPAWTYNLPDANNKTPWYVELWPLGDRILVAGECDLSLLSCNGDVLAYVRGNYPGPQDLPVDCRGTPAQMAVKLGDDILFRCYSWLYRFNPASQKVIWSFNAGNGVSPWPLDGGRRLFLIRRRGRGATLDPLTHSTDGY